MIWNEYIQYIGNEKRLEILYEIRAELSKDPKEENREDVLEKVDKMIDILETDEFHRKNHEEYKLELKELEEKEKKQKNVVIIRQKNKDLKYHEETEKVTIEGIGASDGLCYMFGWGVLRIDFYSKARSNMQAHSRNGCSWLSGIGISSKNIYEFIINLVWLLEHFSNWKTPPLEIRLFNAPKELIPVVQNLVELSSIARKIH